jgi:GxxExxY protein
MQTGIINCRDTETLSFNELTESVIGACIEVHRVLGPGLLESAYEECLCRELTLAGIRFERQKSLPVRYKEVDLDCGYRLDLVVEGKLIVELKAIDGLLPVHEAQLLNYLKLSGLTLGLLINFNVPVLKLGIKRIANHFQDSASPRLCGEIKIG